MHTMHYVEIFLAQTSQYERRDGRLTSITCKIKKNIHYQDVDNMLYMYNSIDYARFLQGQHKDRSDFLLRRRVFRYRRGFGHGRKRRSRQKRMSGMRHRRMGGRRRVVLEGGRVEAVMPMSIVTLIRGHHITFWRVAHCRSSGSSIRIRRIRIHRGHLTNHRGHLTSHTRIHRMHSRNHLVVHASHGR